MKKALLYLLLPLSLAAQTQITPDIYSRVYQTKGWWEHPETPPHLEVAYYWYNDPGDGIKWNLVGTTNGVSFNPRTTGIIGPADKHFQWASIHIDTVRTPGFRYRLVSSPE